MWITIFAFKPIIVGTMIAYEILENGGSQPSAEEVNAYATFDTEGQPGPADEELDDDMEYAYEDERVAA